MYVFTTQLITLLDALDVNDGRSYWMIAEKTQLVKKKVDTRFNQAAYDAAVQHESLSDRMWKVDIQKKNYEEDIIEEVSIRVKEYTLNLSAFLNSKGYEPVLFRDLIDSTITDKNITIDFSECNDPVHFETDNDSALMKHLQRDFHSFSQKLNKPLESHLFKDKLRQILSSFPEDEREELYQKATPVFKTFIAEFFPQLRRKEEEAEKKTMVRLQKNREEFVRKNRNKRPAENSLFWNPTLEAKLEGLEKKYKPDVSQEEKPSLSPSI